MPRATDLAPRQRKKKADLAHLRSLPMDEPATATGRVAWMWPEIRAGLATGKRLKEVWEAAELDGLHIPYPQFRVYVSRLRERERAGKGEPLSASAGAPPDVVSREAAHRVQDQRPDPYHNLRAQREKKKQSGFEYNPFSNRKDLIG